MRCPKCHWENPENQINCLNCGEKLLEEFSLYPPRAKEKLKFKDQKRRLRKTKINLKRLSLSFNFNFLIYFFGLFIPGLTHILMGKKRSGLNLILVFFSLLLLFLITLRHPVSNYLLFFAIILIFYSNFTTILEYFKRNDYNITIPLRIGVLLISLSFLFFSYLFLLFALNCYYIRVKIPDDRLTPVFERGDLVLVNKRAYKNELPKRGDIVAAKIYGYTTIEKILGLPGELVEIKDGVIYINNEPLKEENYPLVKVGNINGSIFLGMNHYYILAYEYYGQKVTLIELNSGNILGKATMIVNPPERRRYIR